MVEIDLSADAEAELHRRIAADGREPLGVRIRCVPG